MAILITIIEGKTYDGVVKKKEEALQQYTEAVSRGESAGMVRYHHTDLNTAKSSIALQLKSVS